MQYSDRKLRANFRQRRSRVLKISIYGISRNGDFQSQFLYFNRKFLRQKEHFPTDYNDYKIQGGGNCLPALPSCTTARHDATGYSIHRCRSSVHPYDTSATLRLACSDGATESQRKRHSHQLTTKCNNNNNIRYWGLLQLVVHLIIFVGQNSVDWNSVRAVATDRHRWRTLAAHCPDKDWRI